MIACKGFPGKGEGLKGKKSVYRFDLRKRELVTKPALVIDPSVFEERKSGKDATKKLREFFDPGATGDFHPSAIAWNEHRRAWFVLAAKGQKLIVLSKGGKLLAVKKLNHKLFRQPEGLAFDAVGNMYIANEGAGDKATLLRFDYHDSTSK